MVLFLQLLWRSENFQNKVFKEQREAFLVLQSSVLIFSNYLHKLITNLFCFDPLCTNNKYN